MAFTIYVIFETARLKVKVVKGSNIAELKAVRRLNRTSNDELEDLLVGGIAAEIDACLVGRLVENDGHWTLEVDRGDAYPTP